MSDEMPPLGSWAWERWVHEQRVAMIMARVRAKQQRVQVPPSEVRDAARARGEKVARLEARYRQLLIRAKTDELPNE